MNELIEFIHSVLNEEHHYDSSEIINIHASLEETFFQLLSSTGYGWIPSEDEMHIIWEILSKLSQDELDRLFYKNNLYHFIDNTAVSQAILFILQSLDAPFMDPNEPPENIIEPLKALTDILYEYVYYNKQIIDRLAKMDSLVRSVSIIQDTDETLFTVPLHSNVYKQTSLIAGRLNSNEHVNQQPSLLIKEEGSTTIERHLLR